MNWGSLFVMALVAAVGFQPLAAVAGVIAITLVLAVQEAITSRRLRQRMQEWMQAQRPVQSQGRHRKPERVREGDEGEEGWIW